MDGSFGDLEGHLAALLRGSMSLAQFSRWFVEAEDEIESGGTARDRDLYRRVFHRFAEYTGGHIDDDELLDALARELSDEALVVSDLRPKPPLR